MKVPRLLAGALTLANLVACGAGDAADPPVAVALRTAVVTRQVLVGGAPGLIQLAPGTTVDDVLAQLASLYALRPEDELRRAGESHGIGGLTYLRLQQYYRGVPVLGHQIVVAHNNNVVQSLSGRFRPAIDVAVAPAINSNEAIEATRQASLVKLGNPTPPPAAGHAVTSLALADDGRGRLVLIHAVELSLGAGTFWSTIDARTRAVVSLDDGRRRIAGTLTHGYDGAVTLDVSVDPGGYRLQTEDGLLHTRNANNSNLPPASSTEVVSATLAFPSSWSADAHYGATMALAYMKDRFQRNGWNNAGGMLEVFGNVQWDNAGFVQAKKQIEVGNLVGGSPVNRGSVDLLGHEIGHAVTYSTVPSLVPGTTGGFIYSGESGALDESFGDMLGTQVEFYARKGQPIPGNWTMFEQPFAPSGSRSLSDPKSKGDPDTYGDPAMWKSTVDPYDFGYVHSNAGVGNKWFYLLADDTTPGGVANTNALGTPYRVHPIGMDAAGTIAYQALFNMPQAAQYADARTATLASAGQLCNVNNVVHVDTIAFQSAWEAWRAVGVGNAGDLAPIPWVLPEPAATGVDPATLTFEFIADFDPAATYTIELDTSAEFPAPIVLAAGPADAYLDVNTNLTKIKVQVPADLVDQNQTYHWRAYNNDTATLAANIRSACYRPSQSFTTGPWKLVLKEPKGPDKHPWNLVFDWEEHPDVVDYEIELYNDDAGTKLEYTAVATMPPIELDVRVGHQYWWRGRAIHNGGEAGQWTSLQAFSTSTPVGEPQLPADNAVLYPWGVELSWKPVVGADKYRLDLTDYPECWPPGQAIESTTVDVGGDKASHTMNYQPQWDGQHLHCWKVTPVGPELFDGKLAAEDGVESKVWKLTTKDHDTLPGSMAPHDKVLNPVFWADRAPYLLFPSVVSTDKIPFEWKGVEKATGYRVDYFPILGTKYDPAALYLLVGPPKHIPASPSIGGEEPPTTEVTWANTIASGFFPQEPETLYGYYYRIVALGPDGTKSPAPPWSGVTSANLFAMDDQFLVPHDYALLAQQESPINTGVVLLRPPPIHIDVAESNGQVWSGEEGSWPGYAVQASAPNATSLWAPWGDYFLAEYTGAGCVDASFVSNMMATNDDNDLGMIPSTLVYTGPASALSISMKVSADYGDDSAADPAKYWAASPFANTPEAKPFTQSSQCVDIAGLPEPEDYGGTDGTPDPPPPDPNTVACSSSVHAGGNAAESPIIELGATSGTTTLTVNTYDVPDKITVYYDGQEVAYTDCVGTSYTLNGCLSNGWCCDGLGSCSKAIPYSGSSSQMTVVVEPNCASSGDTEWMFTLSCP